MAGGARLTAKGAREMRSIRVLVALIVLLVAAAAGFVYSGVYDMSAATAEPKWRERLFETVKDRSIDRRGAGPRAAGPPPSPPQTLRPRVGHFTAGVGPRP